MDSWAFAPSATPACAATVGAGEVRRLPPSYIRKITSVLNALDVARSPSDMDGMGGLHPLHGDRAGLWAVKVSRNWRIVFRFDDNGNACDVDFEDYHYAVGQSQLGAPMYVRQHPGTVIRELWMDGEPPDAVARRIGVQPEELMLLLAGRAPLTPRLAEKLEAAGWSNAPFWMRLQDAYEQAQRHQQPEAQSSTTLPAAASSPS